MTQGVKFHNFFVMVRSACKARLEPRSPQAPFSKRSLRRRADSLGELASRYPRRFDPGAEQPVAAQAQPTIRIP
jgi:hypothetical protein